MSPSSPSFACIPCFFCHSHLYPLSPMSPSSSLYPLSPPPFMSPPFPFVFLSHVSFVSPVFYDSQLGYRSPTHGRVSLIPHRLAVFTVYIISVHTVYTEPQETKLFGQLRLASWFTCLLELQFVSLLRIVFTG